MIHLIIRHYAKAIVIASGLFCAGCASTSQNIHFDIYSISSPLSLERQDPGPEQIARYTIQDTTNNIHTDLIMQQFSTDKKLEDIVKANIQQLQVSIPNISEITQDSDTFVCNTDYITGTYLEYTSTNPEDNEQTLYLGQYLFIHKANLYLLSVMSTKKRAFNRLSKDIQDITCPL